MKFPERDDDGFGPEEAREAAGVSRETLERVQGFLAILDEWRQRINLIGPGEGKHLWRRHVLDSLQLASLVPASAKTLADLGTGGGFPGVILACALHDQGVSVSLVEKSVRKAEFLEDAVRRLGLKAVVYNQRIEEDSPVKSDVVTARALAPLPKLAAMVSGWLAPGGLALLLKGREVDKEMIHTRETWTFDLQTRPSLSGPDGQILMISSLTKRAT